MIMIGVGLLGMCCVAAIKMKFQRSVVPCNFIQIKNSSPPRDLFALVTHCFWLWRICPSRSESNNKYCVTCRLLSWRLPYRNHFVSSFFCFRAAKRKHWILSNFCFLSFLSAGQKGVFIRTSAEPTRFPRILLQLGQSSTFQIRWWCLLAVR